MHDFRRVRGDVRPPEGYIWSVNHHMSYEPSQCRLILPPRPLTLSPKLTRLCTRSFKNCLQNRLLSSTC